MAIVSRYYFLASLLPALKLGSEPEIPFWEFTELCEQNLTPRDLDKTIVMRHYVDIRNLRAYWLEKDLDLHGNYNIRELEEHLLLEEGFPEYVFEFMRKHPRLEDRLKNFPELLATFFAVEIEKADHFLKEFLIFEREWRLITLAIRAKAFKKDIAQELQYEDSFDDLVALLLAQKDADDFQPPEEYESLKSLYYENKDEPMKLHWELENYRLEYIKNMEKRGTFSIDHILGYLAQIVIVENWLKLNHDHGMNVVENIMKEQEL